MCSRMSGASIFGMLASGILAAGDGVAAGGGGAPPGEQLEATSANAKRAGVSFIILI